MRRSSTSSSDPAAGSRRRPGIRRTAPTAAAALGVLVVLLLVGELVARALGPLPADRTWPDAEAQAKAEHAEAVGRSGEGEQVVFSGSSIADAAFDPARVVADLPGTTTYNYSQEGFAAASAADFLETVVVPRSRPRLVVLGLAPSEINDGGTRQRELEESQRTSRGYRTLAGTPTLTDRIDEAFTSRSELFAHRSVLRDPYRLLREHGTPSTTTSNDPDTGALLRYRDETYVAPTRGDAAYRARQRAVWGDYAAGGYQLDAVRRLDRVVRAQGGAVVVVEVPVFRPGFEASIPGGARILDQAHEALVALEAEGCVERLDLRSLLQDERYWTDPVHVNGAGTQVISDAVGAWLADRGLEAPSC